MDLHPDDRPRTWELSFTIRNFANVTSKRMTFFFAISIQSFSRKRLPRLRLKPVMTSMFTLNKGSLADFAADNSMTSLAWQGAGSRDFGRGPGHDRSAAMAFRISVKLQPL